MRGRGRGMRMPRRGGPMMGGRPHLGGGFKPRVIPLRMPFDMLISDPHFPRVKPFPDDTELTQAILKRHGELLPTAQEQSAIQALVLKVQGILEGFAVAPNSLAACQLEEVRVVGSFKKGTMLRGNNIADLVVILKTLPTHEAVKSLGTKTMEDVKAQQTDGDITLELTERGFDLVSTSGGEKAVVRVLVTTVGRNFRHINSSIHLEMQHLQSHLAAVRHSRWFEENVTHSSVKVLIRLLRDVQPRFKGLEALSPWMVDLLAHFCVMNTPNRQVLPINLAFRRVFQLMAAGFFLPGSSGILDPCEVGAMRVHMVLSLEQEDALCATFQTLQRILNQGGHNIILGLEPKSHNIITEVTVLNGIVISPSEPVYDPVVYERKADEDDVEELPLLDEEGERTPLQEQEAVF